MKKTYLALLFFVFLIQFSFWPIFQERAGIPNLILILTIIVWNKKSFIENLGWIFLAGFLFEIFSAESFGFNLIIFVLVGSLAWFLKNIIINKERNIFLEIFFWLVVKIAWDLSIKGGFILTNFFQKSDFDIKLSLFSGEYLFEVIVFIVSGLLLNWGWKFLRNNSFQNFLIKNK